MAAIGLGALTTCWSAAWAQTPGPTLAPLEMPIGSADLILGAAAEGAVFSAAQPGSSAGASGAIKLLPRLQRDYDSGLSLAFAATLAAHDPLSFGRYDGDVVEKAYGEMRILLSTIRIGLTDGAAYDLSLDGPRADDATALNDPRTTFFHTPGSGRAVTELFALRTPVGASSNYTKILIESPTLFGFQVALSFTPSEGKNVLPFLAAGPHVMGRQADIWEGALRYSDDYGPVTLSAYGGAALGRGEHKLPGQHGVIDLGVGGRADYHIDDLLTVSLGGSWRGTNAYAFDINRAYGGAATRALHVSAGVSYEDWSLALEYGNGIAGSAAGNARLGLNGSEASLGYKLSDGISVSAGWQHLFYTRDSGVFFDGSRRLSLDAAFLHLNLATTR